MTVNEIALALAANKNALTFAVTVTRDAKTYKTVTDAVVKQSVITGLFTDYADLAPVADAVADGRRDAPELPKHIKQSVMVGGFRFWEGHNGKFYLPVPLADVPTSVVWFLNGETAEYSAVEPLLTAAEKPNRPTAEELADKGQARFCAVSVENVTAIRV